jgi:hypothetical protein
MFVVLIVLFDLYMDETNYYYYFWFLVVHHLFVEYNDLYHHFLYHNKLVTKY